MEKQQAIEIKTDERIYRVHQLKTVQPYFNDVAEKRMTFEIRKFDKDFNVGDVLLLSEYDPVTDKLRVGVWREVTHMLSDQPYVPEGYVALSMKETEIAIPFV
ncbi:DUF3850 domain-containing protein [Brevibacillus reuszeri]|uniref:DUF3850 domain-containing protein n=1 Tax=Brevibacillus reuszeri TaxID=54915 RepID=UPI003D1E1FBB